jgi:hypothetical protein
MQWTVKSDTHEVEIVEGYEQGGVEQIVVWCNTCKSTDRRLVGIFDHAHYPKYRLAMAAARQVADEHINKFKKDS